MCLNKTSSERAAERDNISSFAALSELVFLFCTPPRGYGPLQGPTRRAMFLRGFQPLLPFQGCFFCNCSVVLQRLVSLCFLSFVPLGLENHFANIIPWVETRGCVPVSLRDLKNNLPVLFRESPKPQRGVKNPARGFNPGDYIHPT